MKKNNVSYNTIIKNKKLVEFEEEESKDEGAKSKEQITKR